MVAGDGSMLGAEVTLQPERVAAGGVFVAHHAGRVVFVPDTLPGETVLARIAEDRHPSFLRAETLQVLEPASGRRPHIWAAASLDRPPEDRAGGAEFGHIAPDLQRELKGAVLTEALARVGRMAPEAVTALGVRVQAAPGTGDGVASRTRVSLHVDGSGRAGPYAARSRRVVPVDDLPLGTAGVQAVAPRVAVPGARRLELVAPSEGEPFAAPHPGARHGSILERVGDREFGLEATGFWQVHPDAPAILSAAVARAVDAALLDPDAANLDLYGGVGLLAAALIDASGEPGTRITTVEGDRLASAHARTNLAGHPRARSVAARVETFLAREQVDPDAAVRATVVLDPPRSGAGAAVVDSLAARAPARIVYVACDPVAFARDAGRFAEHGYRIRSLEAFDLFPGTHHLEAVAALQR